MNNVQRQSIERKLRAMTDGPTPLLHHVAFEGDLIMVHIQPWGGPMVLSWSQAEAFTRDLPIQMPVVRRPVASEQRKIAHKKHATR